MLADSISYKNGCNVSSLKWGRRILSLFLSFALVLCPLFIRLTATIVFAESKDWTWEDSGHNRHTRAELNEILSNHKEWLNTLNEKLGKVGDDEWNKIFKKDSRFINPLQALKWYDINNEPKTENQQLLNLLRDLTQDKRRMNLTQAILYRADLSSADLEGAILNGADLSNSKLTHAKLNYASLNATSFFSSEMVGAELMWADLKGADFNLVNLRGAILHNSDLTRATFFHADLQGSVLRWVNLKDAFFYAADLEGAKFNPTEQPDLWGISEARNLDRLDYDPTPAGLNGLKKSFGDAGFIRAKNQVIAALRRHDSSYFDKVLFDWTCEFGANPARPLLLIGLFWLLFGMAYWRALYLKGTSGLYLVASGQRLNKGEERLHAIRLSYNKITKSNKLYKWWAKRGIGAALMTALLFSLMSAFNLGFRDFDFGRWIRSLQPREFDIKPRGWLRTISGLQSLLSVYLLALFLLSYFSSPFDV